MSFRYEWDVNRNYARDPMPRGARMKQISAAGLDTPAISAGPLFSFTLRPMQSACADIPLPDGPSLAVIEDETGAGKTEAALILHRFRSGQVLMLGGVLFESHGGFPANC